MRFGNSFLSDVLRLAPRILSMAPTVLFKDSEPFGDYANLFIKILKINLGAKLPIYASVDITNSCNLRCKHCYWWKNFESSRGLPVEKWREIIRTVLKKEKIFQVALTGGEPLLRPKIIEVFNEEMPNQVYVVTNGTFPLINFGGVTYYVSVDGTEEIHNNIRGLPIYKKVKQNVENYDGKVFANMSLNTMNSDCIERVVEEWHELVNMMTFQFYTPFSPNDELWVPFGRKRDEIVDRILKLKDNYPDFFLNTENQLNLLRSNEWTKNCPSWAFLSLNHLGKVKTPCFIGGENKPMCERCGMCETAGAFAGLYQLDTEWFEIHKKAACAPIRHRKHQDCNEEKSTYLRSQDRVYQVTTGLPN